MLQNGNATPERIGTHEIAENLTSGRRAITPETALQIGTALGTGARLWLDMQQAYNLHGVEVELCAKVRAEVRSAA